MKKIKIYVMIMLAALILFPSINVFAETTIENISINCGRSAVGIDEELGNVNVTKEHDTYTITNVSWVFKMTADSEWFDYPAIADNSEYYYGLKVSIRPADGYEIGSSTVAKWYSNKGEADFDSYEDTEYGRDYYINFGTPKTLYTLSVDYNGGTVISPLSQEKYEAGDSVSLNQPSPKYVRAPKGKVFDAYEIDGVRYEAAEVYTITKDTVAKCLWKDGVLEQYELTWMDSVIVKFTDVIGYDFGFIVENWSNIDTSEWADDEIADFETHYNNMKKEASKHGELIDIIDFYLDYDYLDSFDNAYRPLYTEGPFKIKIKMTNDMKKYKKIYLIYYNNNGELTEEKVELKVNGEYLEGELDHFSTYAMVAKTEENPKTGDHVGIYIILGLLSMTGMVTLRKLKKD